MIENQFWTDNDEVMLSGQVNLSNTKKDVRSEIDQKALASKLLPVFWATISLVCFATRTFELSFQRRPFLGFLLRQGQVDAG